MPKLIVIDDERHVCDLLYAVFVQEGFTVLCQTDPIQGVETIIRERPDCVLLDVRMPGLTGIEVLAKIKEFDKSIPVVMITAYGELGAAMECVRLGAAEYIAKPFELEAIKALVKKLAAERAGAS